MHDIHDHTIHRRTTQNMLRPYGRSPILFRLFGMEEKTAQRPYLAKLSPLPEHEPFASRLSREYRYFAPLVIRLCDTLENVRMKQGFEVDEKIAG